MTKTRAAAVLLCIGIAGAVFGHGGVTNAAVMARMELMADIKDAMAVLGDMAKGKRPYDARQAEAARAALQQQAADIPDLFQSRETDPKSEARPEIWSDWDGFAAKASDMARAAQGAGTADPEALRASVRALGATCSGCHKSYRIKK